MLALVAIALPAHAASDVTVHFSVGYGYHLLPAPTACDVVVADGATVDAVLDAAVAEGCIGGYAYDEFGSGDATDRFVTCITTQTELCGNDLGLGLEGTFWAFYVDGVAAPAGTSTTHVHQGTSVGFTYSDWWVPFTLP